MTGSLFFAFPHTISRGHLSGNRKLLRARGNGEPHFRKERLREKSLRAEKGGGAAGLPRPIRHSRAGIRHGETRAGAFAAGDGGDALGRSARQPGRGAFVRMRFALRTRGAAGGAFAHQRLGRFFPLEGERAGGGSQREFPRRLGTGRAQRPARPQARTISARLPSPSPRAGL